MTIVGLVFYFSQRNFKKRSNVHRRRWLDSDINIDNYNDGQVCTKIIYILHPANLRKINFPQMYDTNSTLEECQSQPIDLDQDDCPPPYESVVHQSKLSLKKVAQNFAKCSRNYKNTLDASDRNSSKWQWTYHDELQHNTNSMRNSDPLIASQSLNCISTISNENSLLIENRRTASTSSPEEDRPNRDEECTIRGKCFKDDFKVDIHRLQNALLVETERQDEKLEIVPTKTVGCENEFALLDASGLPSYDTALKIQECGNM